MDAPDKPPENAPAKPGNGAAVAAPSPPSALRFLDFLVRNGACLARVHGVAPADVELCLYVLSRGGLDGSCFASNRRIATEMGHDLRWLQRRVARLGAIGWLQVEHEAGRRRHLRIGL